jgi:hypothetical protein
MGVVLEVDLHARSPGWNRDSWLPCRRHGAAIIHPGWPIRFGPAGGPRRRRLGISVLGAGLERDAADRGEA